MSNPIAQRRGRWVTARKAHVCANCGKPINVGERYRRVNGPMYGAPLAFHAPEGGRRRGGAGGIHGGRLGVGAASSGAGPSGRRG